MTIKFYHNYKMIIIRVFNFAINIYFTETPWMSDKKFKPSFEIFKIKK